MSDAHGDGHGSDKKADSGGSDKSYMVDGIFSRITDFITGEISKLVFFIFIILTVGAIIGYEIAVRTAEPLWLLAPLAVGIIAYYERDIAILFFVVLLLIFIL